MSAFLHFASTYLHAWQPWNKVTGEIYPDAVQYWKPFDLSHYITGNWNGSKNLGDVLRHRIFIYVGSHDNYYLNEGVMKFQQNVESYGGPQWVRISRCCFGSYLITNNIPLPGQRDHPRR